MSPYCPNCGRKAWLCGLRHLWKDTAIPSLAGAVVGAAVGVLWAVLTNIYGN